MNLVKTMRKVIIDFKMIKARRALKNSQKEVYKVRGPVMSYDQALLCKRQIMKKSVESLINKVNSQGQHREEVIYLTLIYFSAIGSHMVKKADQWLNTWGEGFTEMGYPSIGEAYQEHAREEVGHDKWHRQDVRTLVKVYNQKFNGNLDAKKIIENAKINCVKIYEKLSEDEIPPSKAYLSLAELYETEIMAMELAPDFIGYCVSEVGFEILKGLKFLSGHIVADVEHIADNVKQMNTYLKNNGNKVPELVKVGEQTIDIYIDYFQSAVELAVQTHQQNQAVNCA